VKPVLQALVLAERIYSDTTGKKIIAGTFNTYTIGRVRLEPEKMPDGTERPRWLGGADPGSPSLYISLTDVVDGTEIGLQFINVTRNEMLFRNNMKINCNDRLGTVEIVAPLPPLHAIANKEGTYSLDVLWNNEILGSHRIMVKENKETTA
jgi:hypothetical protein